MKKYIIVTYNVCNMGGGQLYVLRRCKHLKAQGFEVLIIVSYDSGYFPLQHVFEGTPILLYEEMRDASAKVSNKRKREIIGAVMAFVGKSTENYVESHTLYSTEWGEIIASSCHARHLAYPLAEPKFSSVKFSPAKEIISAKYQNGEFYGCTSTSLKTIFREDPINNNYVNIGFDINEFVEISKPLIQFKKQQGDYVITTVGRLSKEYIEPFIEAVCRFAKTHQDQRIVLLLVGGSPVKEREEYLKAKYSNEALNIDNLNVIFVGYIKELGKDIFSMTDLFVGMGTASINSISQGCLTLNIDPESNKTSGFFGTDTLNFAYSESGELWEIEDKIEEAYSSALQKKAALIEAGRKLYKEAFENEACMKKLDEAISSIPVSTEQRLPHIPFYYLLFVRSGVAMRRLIRRFQSIIR